jgi:hypothetical protein
VRRSTIDNTSLGERFTYRLLLAFHWWDFLKLHTSHSPTHALENVSFVAIDKFLSARYLQISVFFELHLGFEQWDIHVPKTSCLALSAHALQTRKFVCDQSLIKGTLPGKQNTYSLYACNEINLMHYLSSVYSVTIPLHVSGLLVALHHEVTKYICNNWYVLYVLVYCQLTWLERNWFHYTQISKSTINKT